MDDVTRLRALIAEIIRKCKTGDSASGKPWCLYAHDGKKLLGRHPSRASAERQERAIRARGG